MKALKITIEERNFVAYIPLQRRGAHILLKEIENCIKEGVPLRLYHPDRCYSIPLQVLETCIIELEEIQTT